MAITFGQKKKPFGCKKIQKLYSRMRSKGPRFTLGVWGLRVCSLDVAFVAATVHNRSQPLSRFEAHFEVKSAKKKLTVSDHLWKLR